jgi:hypothetical protein
MLEAKRRRGRGGGRTSYVWCAQISQEKSRRKEGGDKDLRRKGGITAHKREMGQEHGLGSTKKWARSTSLKTIGAQTEYDPETVGGGGPRGD